MNFNSLSYLQFLFFTVLLYYILPHKLKNPLLLIVSYVFYMLWEPRFALLLAFATVFSWLIALRMQKSANKKAWLCIGLAVLLGLLVFFKYASFAVKIVSDIRSIIGLSAIELPSIILPVGISFFTFTVCAYLIDVYRAKNPAEGNLLNYALFVSFFPSILSGPIVRGHNLLPQYREKHSFDPQNIREGFTMFLWGLFKKMVIADSAAIIVNTFYAWPNSFNSPQAVFALFMYSIQIYCDFSSYSEMAIGSARMLGFDLGENFRRPYTAASVKEFWRRWHISLTSWFRDYIYFPLGGSRKGKIRTYLNLLIVFLVSGLWHGAAYTFIIWGVLNGLYQVIGEILKPFKDTAAKTLHIPATVRKLFGICFTFALISLSWVFFRSNSLELAWAVIVRAAHLPFELWARDFTVLGMTAPQLYVLLSAIILLVIVEFISEKWDIFQKLNTCVIPRYIVYIFLALAISLFGAYGSGFNAQEFVYFQF